MPRGPAPSWKARKQPVLDHLIHASIEQAGGKHHPETGHYATIRYTGIETRERAQEIVRALHRSAMYLHKRKLASVGCKTEIVKENGSFTVVFNAVDKAKAREHVVAKYGEDPNKWPYYSRRRGN